MKDWRAYLGSGLIKEVRPNFRQIERQVLRAEKDLRTFELVIEADPEWASTIAYQARKSLETGEKLLKAVKVKIAERNPQIGLD